MPERTKIVAGRSCQSQSYLALTFLTSCAPDSAQPDDDDKARSYFGNCFFAQEGDVSRQLLFDNLFVDSSSIDIVHRGIARQRAFRLQEVVDFVVELFVLADY